ncbi:AAA family ATPase [Curtobacterium flaccumfaciens]|uniref:P-loop NTPase fold protein n=1 Tax=Curtobacterium flaccumfaciens TaxID=2035 RepID=UPI00188A98EC|nr:P-loop NTPase fold protein [Curtobacterium flaccumfaciens]MBF4595556.1 AAA family ATPase [Curtobacterium flaccumfaciens]
MTDGNTPAWFSDDPLGAEDADSLNRTSFADAVVALLEMVGSQEASSVLGLIGPWGAGKSSLLHAIAGQLRAIQKGERSWVVTEFNPWFYSDLASLQNGFFAQLSGAIQSGPSWRKLRNSIADFGQSVAPLGSFGSLAGVDASGAVDGVSRLIRGSQSAASVKSAVEKELRSVNRPILVVVDDVDRLDPQELLLLFKLIRLAGRLPNVYYLLAYDEDTLLDALSRTGLIGGDTPRRAIDYLEKIVQIRLDVPPLRSEQISTWVDREIDKLAVRHAIEMTDDVASRFSRAYFGHIRQRLSTPRAIKRFFAQVDAFLGQVRGEVDFVDFLILSWLRAAEPLIYAALIENRARLLGEVDWSTYSFDKKRDVGLDQRHWRSVFDRARVSPERERGVADLLGQLFPRFAYEWSDSEQATPSVDVAAGRLANTDYFDRYFALGVPEEDLPDGVVAAASDQIATHQSGPELREVERAWPQRTNLIVSKLQQYWLPGSRPVKDWLLWLTRRYPAIPERNEVFGDAQMRVQWFGRELFSGLSPDDAFAFAKESIAGAGDAELHFIARIVANKGARSDVAIDGQAAPAFDSARRVVAERIGVRFAEQGDANPLSYPDEVWRLFWIWGELDADGPRKWATARLDQSAWPPLDLVARMVSTSIALGVRNPIPRLSDLDMKRVGDVVGMDRIFRAHGAEIDAFEERLDADLDVTDEKRRKFVLARLKALRVKGRAESEE